MTITSVARWNGGSREAVLALGKQIKPIHAKYGGEARIEHIHTGPHAGQWLIRSAIPTGRPTARRRKRWPTTPSTQLRGQMMGISHMDDRTILVGHDV